MIILSESAPDIFPVDTTSNKLVTLGEELINTEPVISDKGIMGEVNDEDEIARNKYNNRVLDHTKTNELLTETGHSSFLFIKNENEVQPESTVSFKFLYNKA